MYSLQFVAVSQRVIGCLSPVTSSSYNVASNRCRLPVQNTMPVTHFTVEMTCWELWLFETAMVLLMNQSSVGNFTSTNDIATKY